MMRPKALRHSVLAATAAVTLLSCTRGAPAPSDTTAITNRPEDWEQFIAILKP